MKDTFDNTLSDTQGSCVEPVKPADFDFDAYVDYEAGLLEGNRTFWESDSGVVGSSETIVEKAKPLWKPGMKLILVTYCSAPGEQEAVYREIHALAAE